MVEQAEIGHFDANDVEGWKNHLLAHGVVVLQNVISQQEREHVHSLYWDKLESLSQINRNDINTWINQNWPSTNGGFSTNWGQAHSEAAWFLRSLPQVKAPFAHIWDCDPNNLITSFDTFLTWRPFFQNKDFKIAGEKWMPKTEGLHCDQNPFDKEGLHCVQGMLPMYDVTQETGGLEVIPDTNTDQWQEYLRQRYPNVQGRGDWVLLRKNTEAEPDREPLQGQGRLVECQAGDMILWDSRTIHGGVVGSGLPNTEPLPTQLTRLSLTVCMTNKQLATEEDLIRRREAFQEGQCTTHWPHEFKANSMGSGRLRNQNYQYVPIETNDAIRSLIG